MALTKEVKSQVIQKFHLSDLDTGSSEVQIALLTARIVDLTDHFKKNKKDHHSRRGLVHMVNRRRKLLDYLKSKKPESYTSLIAELQIRK